MLKINVTTAEAVVTETELITAGRKGLRCAFTFSDDWAGLAKTAIVQGAAARDIALLATNEIVVPAECVNKAQFPLKIGVYGALPDGTIAIPTIWASFGKVLPGAKPSLIPPDELTPDVVAQIIEASSNALYLARNVQSMADSGELDGVSPAVTVTSITGGHNIKITDRDHPDGQDFDVPDGTDGVSPEVSIASITGGHAVTITDADHPTGQTFNVMDGQDAVVDATLSNAGEAADAAVTGAGISAAQHTGDYALLFAETLNNGAGIPVDGVWERGGIGTNGNAENTRTYRARTKNKLSYPVAITLKAASGYRFQLASYRQDGTFVDITDGTTSRDVPANTIFRLVSKKVPEDTGELADPAEFGSKITIQNNRGSGGGGSITVDSALSDSSENPVQNKVIKAALDNKGTYSKPSGGIPKTDLASAVQTSLGKADTALQPGDVDEPFVVTYTAASGATATCDKTYAQIMAALQAKQEVLAFYVASNSVAAQLTTVAIDTNNSDILFTNAQNGGVTTLRHNSAGTITVSSNDGYVFRDQGIAHAGEFLVVGNDGTVTTMTLSTWSAGSY